MFVPRRAMGRGNGARRPTRFSQMDPQCLQENRMSLVRRVFRPLSSAVGPIITLAFALPVVADAQNAPSTQAAGWVKEFGTM